MPEQGHGGQRLEPSPSIHCLPASQPACGALHFVVNHCPVQSCCPRTVWSLSTIGLCPWSSRLETWFGRRTGLLARPAKNTEQSITSDRLSGTHSAGICYLWILGSGDQWGHDGSSRSLCEEQRQRCEAKLSLSPRWRNRSGLAPPACLTAEADGQTPGPAVPTVVF